MARCSLKLKCQWCGRKLTGVQQKWCGQRCATRAWYDKHPEVTHRQQKGYRTRHRIRLRRWHRAYYLRNKRKIRENHKEYYRKNFKRLSSLNNAWKKKRSEDFRVIVREYKNKPCADCGKRYPYYIMELDHVRGKKLCNPTDLRNKASSLKKLMRELAKCEPVCANCHRERTQQSKMKGIMH